MVQRVHHVIIYFSLSMTRRTAYTKPNLYLLLNVRDQVASSIVYTPMY